MPQIDLSELLAEAVNNDDAGEAPFAYTRDDAEIQSQPSDAEMVDEGAGRDVDEDDDI